MSAPIAAVTGASSGIGAEIATALAATGHDVLLGYGTNAEAAKEHAGRIAAEHGVRTETVALDLASPASAAQALARAVEAFGGLDVLVNNAGVNRRADAVDETDQDWERVLTINLSSPFALSRTAANLMLSQGRGGRIVNITSCHEHYPIGGGGAYCASKAGLGALTKVMALELAPHGITVNAVAPGETATPMNGVPLGVDAAGIARPAIPVGRPARTSEIAALVAHLASPEAAYTTGSSVVVDGGLGLTAAVANAARAGTV
ncbi:MULTISPECIES: SDR family oxidoreductase [Actinosynnema]|uniref:SDR family oxidoreductase n=1 Tax=Actinosynnema TaxID=40566 RepID=UPI0020A3A40B|nr:SDR family oxidoreductase [Actinosynnema pretiosum]MCP2094789.1 hypothetical protein [Actinosynnema pretiosum]